MSQDAYMPRNKVLDEIINGATDASEMLARLHQYNLDIAAHTISPPPPSAPPTPVEQSQKTDAYYEVLYPDGNDRIEISAPSQKELDYKREKILAMYKK